MEVQSEMKASNTGLIFAIIFIFIVVMLDIRFNDLVAVQNRMIQYNCAVDNAVEAAMDRLVEVDYGWKKKINKEEAVQCFYDSLSINFGVYDNKDLKEKLKGYIVLKDEDRLVKGKYPLKLGSIVDLIAEDEDSVVALCEKANKYFKSIGVDFAVCWILDGMKYGDTLKNVGFIKTKSRIPFAVKNLTEDSSIDDHIFKEENWYLMPIESDIY